MQILEKNYLEVYHYENWNVKEIHSYRQNDTFNPTSIELVDGETSAPNLLTEPELISLMEKNGIGKIISRKIFTYTFFCNFT